MITNLISVPQFCNIRDIQSIRNSVAEKGYAFIEECDENSMVALAMQLGRIVTPRNESKSGSGVSNIRCAPSLVGKGYSSEGLSASPRERGAEAYLESQNCFSILTEVDGTSPLVSSLQHSRSSRRPAENQYW